MLLWLQVNETPSGTGNFVNSGLQLFRCSNAVKRMLTMQRLINYVTFAGGLQT
jgi:hypothetical protein